MVDFAKKITKHRSGDLHPGEEVEAALYVQPVGAFGRSLGMQLGGIVGAVATDRAAKKREGKAAESEAAADVPEDGGLAAQITVSPAVLGLSAQRLLVFGHSSLSGRPKELNVSYPLQDVAAVTAEKKKLSSALQIQFRDGSAAQFEVVKPGKPGPMIEAFERLRSSAS